MKLSFTEDNDLKVLGDELEGVDYFPSFKKILKNVSGRNFRMVYSKKGRQTVGGCLWYGEKDKAHIYLIFTKRDFEGKGYAQNTLQYVLDQVKKDGFDQVSACVDRSNKKSACLFLGNDFKLASFMFDKNLFLFLRKFEEENYSVLLQDHLLEEDLDKRKATLEKLLLDPQASLCALRKPNSQLYDGLSPINRYKFLKSVAESDSSGGLRALGELSREVEDVGGLEDANSRLRLLKYIAIHAEKKFSLRAIDLLDENMGDILKLKNPELQASFLRYLAIHLRGDRQAVAINHLKKIKNKLVRGTSLDYFTLYAKNGKKR